MLPSARAGPSAGEGRPARTVIVASNRGPVTFVPDQEGGFRPERGAGGLVTALLGAMHATDGLWLAAAMTDGDRAVALRAGGRVDVATDGRTSRLRFVLVPPRTYDRYYNQVANGILWFVHHYLWDPVRSPSFGRETEAAWRDYVAVNRIFAEALAEEADRATHPPVFLVQDYHLSLVPRLLRERRPDALIAHFSHTPMSGPTYLRILPTEMRDGLLRGLLGADVLGFHSRAWADNFLMSARSVQGARVDLARSRVVIEGREVLVRVHPISVDPEAMREKAATPGVDRMRRQIERWRGGARLVLRVDRLELTKNIVRGFQAFGLFLRTHPEWRRRVRFLALLSPSRQQLSEYRTYRRECLAEAERVNRELGEAGWSPIEVRIKQGYPRALAAYAVYDVLLVNPVFDGMNLVSMEGPLLNRRNGVLILSRNAGAYWRLGRYALGVNPFDLRETAEAIARALEMPEHERARRARGLARLILANPPERWVREQLDDLEEATRRRPGRPGP